MGRLKALYPDAQFTQKIIKTTGDTVWDQPLHLIGGKGLFVKEIEEALLAGDIDIAVHSMKDMPAELPEGLTLGAVLERENPRDAFISAKHRQLSDVGPGGRIGTGSVRRKSQLLALNRSLEVVPLRGNVDTRLRKLREQNLDGIILACAGVKRMGFGEQITEVLPFHVMVPPSGQGAIGIETRAEAALLELLRPLNHDPTMFEVTIERKLQALIGGGCTVPLGINASAENGELTIHSALGADEGGLIIKQHLTGPIGDADRLIAESLAGIQDAQKKQGHT
jgi:hydroxymethylbilane synthase